MCHNDKIQSICRTGDYPKVDWPSGKIVYSKTFKYEIDPLKETGKANTEEKRNEAKPKLGSPSLALDIASRGYVQSFWRLCPELAHPVSNVP